MLIESYLAVGKMGDDGVMQITACDIVMAWYDVTADEREALKDMRC